MTAPLPLTGRQLRVLTAVRELTAELGYCPSYREIGAHSGLSSPGSVARQLSELARKGYVRLGGVRPRTIVVVDLPVWSTREAVAELLGVDPAPLTDMDWPAIDVCADWCCAKGCPQPDEFGCTCTVPGRWCTCGARDVARMRFLLGEA